MRSVRAAVLLSALIGISNASANREPAAADVQIKLLPASSVVDLSGRPGSDSSLTARVTLMAEKDVHELLFRPSDLKLDGGTEIIARSQIQLVSGSAALQNLMANTPRDIDFKVSGLKLPGTYSGAVEFLQPQHGLTAAVHFDLKVHVQEAPKLSVRNGSTTLKVQIVNCFPWIGCFLSKTLYGPTEDHSFPLDNGSVMPFRVTGAAAAYGDLNHRNTGTSLQLNLSKPVEPNPIVTIPLAVNSGDLTPDHYVGDVQLRIPGKDEPLKIPLELNVKTGPELPILFLIVGILFGRLIKYMKDKGIPQSDLLRQFLEVQARAAQDPQNLGLLQHMLEQVRTNIDQMKLDTAKADLAMIGNRLTLLSRLRYLETLLTPRSGDEGIVAVLNNIKLARSQISTEADPTDTAKQIETQVQALPALAAPVDSAVRAMEVAAATGVRGAAAFTMPPAPPDGAAPGPNRWRRLVAKLTGHGDALRADLTHWFVRPMMWVVLILALVVTGFLQLYAKNASFGADPISDYFGLFVWAVGSDVASRTLSNLKGAS